jgi:Carboxypeptidase regulatory-like domain
MKRVVIAALCFIGAAGSAVAQSTISDPSVYPNLAGSVLLTNAVTPANVPECRGVALAQEIVSLVQNATEDPEEAFERWRTERRSMVEMSPAIECQSKLWQALRRGQGIGNTATVPAGTETFGLRPAADDSPQARFLRELMARGEAASIGGNVVVAGGVENYQGEMQIAVNPNNHQQLVAGANHFFADPNCLRPGGGATNGTQALYGSTDGGATWNYRCAPWPSDISGSVSGAAFFFGSDPALAWNSQGHAFVAYMLLNCNSAQTSCGYSIVVARSTDVGQTWVPWGTVVNHSGDNTHGDDKEMVAVDNSPGPASTKSHPGRVYVIWDDLNVERVAYSDNGTSWTTVVLPISTNAIGGNLVVGSDGTVYAIWNRLNDPELIVFSKSVDGGNTWTTPVTAASSVLLSFGTNNKPPAQESRGINAFGSIGMDSNPASPYFGNLYIAYNDFPTGTSTGTNINIYMVMSSDGGASWSPKVKVNDDAGTATQLFPWLAVDQSDGTVNVSWYDSRVDAANNRKTQVFYARSSNGGISFEPNLLVTDNGGVIWRNAVNYSDENTTDNASRNGNQYGDYAGIAAYNRQVHPFWMDSRNFFPSADTVSPTRREDAASSTIVNCSAPTSVAIPAVGANCAAPRVTVSWSAPGGWGTNATSGTYSVYRNTTPVFTGATLLASNLAVTSYDDLSGLPTVTYYYFVVAKNNCPGTTLTPMSTTSAVSAPIVFPACGATVGTLQGTVTASGFPLAGVAISASPYSTTTDAAGFYTIGPIPTGLYTVTATKTGYAVGTANNVPVNDGATTTQNFSLVASTTGSCFTDTTKTEFEAGTITSLDSTTTPGDLKLSLTVPEGVNQHADDNGFGSGYGFTNTAPIAQTFTPSVTATLTKVDMSMFCASCSGTNPNLTVEIRTTSAGLPVMTAGGLLATATAVPGFSSSGTKTATFPAPPTLTSGTQYAFVVKLVSARGAGTQAWLSSSGDVMAGGRRLVCASTAACANPTGSNSNSDLIFAAYMKSTTFQTSGNLVSTVKDSAPVTGSATTWTTLSWTATTPANTTVRFQAAGSNNVAGPFNFVGPDGTAGTFFTVSGASLSQFNGNRYLKYKAYLSTTDNTATPTLSDVTVCNAYVDCTSSIPTITPTPASVCTLSTGNTASGPAGMTSYAWTISNGSITGGAASQTVTYTAGSSGNVTLGLTVTTAGGCTTVNSANVPIIVVPTPTVTPGGPTTFCAGGSVTLTSSSASGNQWSVGGNPIGGATNQNYIATATGAYTVTVTTSGCTSAPSTATNVTVNPTPPTPTITPGGPTTFCTGGSVTLTSSSASGNQWYDGLTLLAGQTNQNYVATTSGNYNVIVTTAGCSSAPSASTAVTVNPTPATPTVTPGGPTTFCAGGSVTLTSSSATGNQWYDGLTLLAGETNQTYVATTSGNYNVVVTASGCSSAPSVSTAVTVNPIPATPTVTPSGPTTFCTGGSVTLTSSSATGNQWYDGVTLLVGETNQTYVATTSGNYNVVVTSNGCSSAPSASTAVTVNPVPATPTVTPSGPTTFCSGGSVTLTSSSATGNQWYDGVTLLVGETNQTYVATTSGNYNVVMTASGCSSAPSASTTVTVNPIPATPTVTPSGPTTFCTGGSVTLTSSSATGNQWYDGVTLLVGETNQTYVATTSGNYNVVVTSNGCSSAPSASTAVTVNPVPPTPTVTPSGPTTFCSGGSVTLTSSSATGNQWYDGVTLLVGETNQTYVATTSGNYNVVVTASGCSSAPSASTAVTVNPIPATPTVTPSGPTTFCTGGSVTLTSSSATGNQWYDGVTLLVGETNQNYIATTSGSYNVVVTTNGCSSAPSASTTVTVNPIPATPTVTPGGPTTFCSGGSVTLTSSSATGNQWFNGVTLLVGETNQNYIATTSGNYNVVVTANGCSSAHSASTAVTVNPTPATPTITPGGPTTFCTGGSVTLTSSSATGNQWFNGLTPLAGETNQNYIATTSGNYNVVVTSNGCSSAPSASTTVTVTPIPATPTVTPGGPTTFCAGGSVTLTSSSATGNQWFNGLTPLAGETNQNYIATTSGNYNVVVTSNGCSSAPSASTAVTVNPTPATPTITPGGPTTFCTGGSVTLTSSSATGNQWFNGLTPLAGETNQNYIATTSGNYNVVVTTNGCSSAPSASTSVTVNPIPATPTVTPGGPTTFCSAGSVTLTSSSATGNQWFNGLTPLAGETNQNYIATTSGNYNVVVTSNGCSSAPSASTAVTVNPIPATPTVTPGGPTTFCSGGSVTLTSSSATGNQWFNGLTLLAGETNQNYIATTSGNYNVVVTSNGCSSAHSASTAVTVNPTPATPTISPSGPTTFCTGGSVTLTSSSATGNQWFNGLTPLGGETNQNYIAMTSGNYNVVVTASGCSSAPSASTIVTVNPVPSTPTVTPGGSTTFCAGGSVTLTSSSASGNQWYDGVTLLVGQTSQNYVATASGNYNVVVTTSGCSSAHSASTAVTVNPVPATPTVTPGGPTTFCAGGSVTLTSSSATGNQWYDGVTLLAGETSQNYVATTSGNYKVVVTASGCPSAPSASTVVTVNPIPATPTISPAGQTAFCEGGSVVLTSSSATGNQWYRNGVAMGGETAQTHVATTGGYYTVTVTTNGCPSPASLPTFVLVNPKPDATITVASPMFSGAISTASVAVSCGGASFFWTITGGTITGGAGTPIITFTAGAAGTLTLEVTVTTAAGCTDTKSVNVTVQNAPFGPPPSFQANASGTTSANLNWAPVLSADHYEIHRSTDNVNWTLRGTSAGTTFSEGGLTPATTYFYKVRTVKADTTLSAFSAIDPATMFVFTDDPLTMCGTVVKAVHVTQLRTAVNIARASIGLSAFSFTDPSLAPGAAIKAVHMSELRTALAPLLTAIGVTPSYTDPTITGGTTKVKAAHVRQLRDLIR